MNTNTNSPSPPFQTTVAAANIVSYETAIVAAIKATYKVVIS